MPIFIIPVIVWIVIQIVKGLFDYNKGKKFHAEILRSPWWFPSVHSWISSSITTLMFLVEWIHSPIFAVTFGFSILFWYDSMNVRYEAGKHARYINKISEDLKTILNLSDKHKFLKERLWHTFFEVAWWILIGAISTIILYHFIYGLKW